MIAQVEVLIGEDLPLTGQVSMVAGVSIIILLLVVGDSMLQWATTVLKLHPLISEAGRLLCFEVYCLLRFKIQLYCFNLLNAFLHC